MKIQFCGAATSVTGSCHLISTENHKILLDCGQFQGGAAMEALNWEEFPFNPAEIEAVILSHAHIDHCGRLPLLVKRGFKGDIICTDATCDLVDVMLKDSAHIHEQEAEWKNRKAERAGRARVEPLYTADDALDTIKLLKPYTYDTLIELNDEMKIVFNDAGHILGSAIIELWVKDENLEKKLVFSGDLGMSDRPILKDPTYIHKADYVVMETTYGNRLHEKNAESIQKLMDIIVSTVKRGGNVVIPSFAVGRTQELIFELNKIYDGDNPYKEVLKDVHVYIDSPMAAEATEIFKNNAQTYDDEMKDYILRGDHPLDFANLHFTRTSDESRMINVDSKPKIIISASGMCDAGRIRHHLKHNLYNPLASIVFVGYQAEGTLGRNLIEGAESVTLFGEEIAVKAQIHNLEGFSGHADRDALYKWLSTFEVQPKSIFLVHGEPEAKSDFAKYVKENKGWNCIVVDGYNEYELKDVTTVTSMRAEKEFVSDREVDDMRLRLADIHEELNKVLYNTTGAVSNDITAEKLVEIKNIMASLEKDIMNLGSTITKEDRSEDDVLPLEGELPPKEDYKK